MACKNGHDTINSVGNCYTCGEPDASAGESSAEGQDVKAAASAPIEQKLSLKMLERLRADAEYIVASCNDAINELTAKKEG
jgi:hypothetical protein